MSEETEINHVPTNDPRIREYTIGMYKMGLSKEEAMKRIGMPMEVIDRIYREAEREKK